MYGYVFKAVKKNGLKRKYCFFYMGIKFLIEKLRSDQVMFTLAVIRGISYTHIMQDQNMKSLKKNRSY